MKPAIGRIVHYRLSAGDAEVIVQGRQNAVRHGNSVSEGEIFPAMIVAAWSRTGVNLQVFLDGSDSHWATSRYEGTEPGQWRWPTREDGLPAPMT
jgi:hypothetical protein